MTTMPSIDHDHGAVSPARAINTPGFGGYLLAILLSAVAFDLELCLVNDELLGPGDGVGPAGIVALFLFTLLVAIPVGLAGALMVHLCCWKQPWQAVHVIGAFCSVYAIAAWIGFFMGAWLRLSVSGLGDEVVALLPVAVAGAAGRAAVIPLVRRRREAA